MIKYHLNISLAYGQTEQTLVYLIRVKAVCFIDWLAQ